MAAFGSTRGPLQPGLEAGAWRARRAAASRVAATRAVSVSSVPAIPASRPCSFVRGRYHTLYFRSYPCSCQLAPWVNCSNVHGAGYWLCNTEVFAETTGFECPIDGGPPTTCLSVLHSRVSLLRELHTRTTHTLKHALTVAFLRVFRPLFLGPIPRTLRSSCRVVLRLRCPFYCTKM